MLPEMSAVREPGTDKRRTTVSEPQTSTDTLPAWQQVPPPEPPTREAEDTRNATRAKTDPFHKGTVYTIKGWRYRLLLQPASLLLRLYYATLRISMSAEDAQTIRDTSRPVVGLLWHNRSFIIPLVFTKMRVAEKCHCLISPSKAAAWEEGMFRTMRIPAARGSSSRRSIQAMRELIRANAEGKDIYISPDGPSGPRYEFKRGAVAAARITKAPLLLIGAECENAWRPNTWDRHLFPLPFAKLRLKARLIENAELFDGTKDDEAAAKHLAKRLSEINADNGL